jgi:arginyl-tRNA synthetase
MVKRVMVEYSSPNTNKPLHLGHIRNNLLGFSVAEILVRCRLRCNKSQFGERQGHPHLQKHAGLARVWQRRNTRKQRLKGDHLAGKYYVWFDKAYKQQIQELVEEGQTEDEAKKNAPLIKEAQEMLLQWEAGDPAVINLWKTMNGWVYDGFDVTYKTLGVNFDKYYYESNTYLLGKDIVEEGLAKGVFFKKEDGSVWIDLTAEGLDQKLVLRADGTSVYITQDLGTAQLKYDDFKMDESIYVVGNEQDYHFKVLVPDILQKLGKSWAQGLYHLSYGMVDLPSGKMKSREGTVVDADDLMADMFNTAPKQTEEMGKVDGFTEDDKNKLYRTIGMGALKYFLLKVDPKKRLLFDPSESVDFQGHTGPFIQYTHARIKSVLSRANYTVEGSQNDVAELDGIERDLIVTLANSPKLLQKRQQGIARR